MVYSDYGALVDLIKRYPDGKVYYSWAREFFIDDRHIRLLNSHGYPMPFVGYAIVKRGLFTTTHNSFFEPSEVNPGEYIFFPDVAKYHYGWITDFDKQVAKHVRNVKSGLWGDRGEDILKGKEMGLWVWAITHVNNYSKEVAFEYASHEAHPLKDIAFDYLKGFDQAVKDFKKKFKKDYYEAV
jgi:hypothetical protein